MLTQVDVGDQAESFHVDTDTDPVKHLSKHLLLVKHILINFERGWHWNFSSVSLSSHCRRFCHSFRRLNGVANLRNIDFKVSPQFLHIEPEVILKRCRVQLLDEKHSIGF